MLAAVACSDSLRAHHSGRLYDPSPIWIEGTVVRFENIDPHTITTLEARSADGPVRRWSVEGPGQSQFKRMGIDMDVPAVGDVLQFCAFPYRSIPELTRLYPGVDFSGLRASAHLDGSSPQSVGGHVMVTPNGEKRLWEPHGLIGECIRSSEEERQSWIDFVNSNLRVWQNWCQQMENAHTRSTASLMELVEEVNSLIDDPCE